MAKSFKNRFDLAVARLRAHPDVEVFEAQLNPPIRPIDLRAVEQTLGRRLPPGLRDFYRSHNGAFLEWGFKGEEYRYKTAPFDFPDYGQPPGCINLLPAEEVFSPSWEQHSLLNEVNDSLWELLYGATPDPLPPFGAVALDNFNKYHVGALILGPELMVLAATDHGADLEASDFIDVDTYLDLTLDLYGANRYTFALGVGWTRPGERYTRPSPPPALQDIIARVRIDEGLDEPPPEPEEDEDEEA